MKSETNKRSRGVLLSRREASTSSLLQLWLKPRSPCQHMSWPRVLTTALRGFHQASRDLPTVQTTATLIVHCAAAFLQSTSRILCSVALRSILKVSYHLLCQVKPVPRTRTVNTFHCADPPSRCLAKIRLWMWMTWEASQSSFQAHFEPAKPPPLSTTAALLRALGRQGFAVSITCAVKPIAFLARCEFGRVYNFGALQCELCPETHILPSLSSPPHPTTQAHRSTCAPV